MDLSVLFHPIWALPAAQVPGVETAQRRLKTPETASGSLRFF
jgi:hypothetical protein